MGKINRVYGIVLVTTASREEAEAIASALLEARLAACINFMPIHSRYRWQGEIQIDEEWQLLIKTDLALLSTIETKICQLHSYQVPEIIALPISHGSEPYLTWIGENVIG